VVEELEGIIIEAGFTPRYLKDFGKESEPLINKLNKAKVCSHAIVLLTSDDFGIKKEDITKLIEKYEMNRKRVHEL